ncbi:MULTISPECIES: peptidoglycan-binding domain-containing protein [Methylobacterium]|uniref:Peptidoglycan binding-like domain-containing protein n=1 Tax=Methylobacterium jeotgali TaxID=381630 RepID=A0ABQ4T2H4_9HYPH|nr:MULTISPECIES: peptidoglycan-binding domain-containing protein [Methylobacterium]PIU04625.1 MAG: hypothetical protein COT56_19005 [Methylobacterium sp. CG09_land_8_20_14_0_10_71_15]PIU14396.1 MAG: hypothetical protein COT28_08050 [Methylobacterium sp. CG08_land_8_20_14_0_20_71_15]GBU19405.1 peptidoglycan-binding protein [Methylobacterium sp.]GJE08463.1 hypothetical protein AOPFMNJM_3800 [Methylobacterium jeotgali]
MREQTRPRDPRDIAVPGDMRASGRPKRTSRPPASGAFRTSLRTGLAALAGFARLCRRHPGEVVGSLAALAATAAVAVNALGSQNGRHPAPILPKMVIKDAPKETARPRLAEAPPAAPVPRQVPAEPAPVVKEPPRKPDPIAEIIRGEDTTASVNPQPDRAVIQAQKALAKLGYGPLKPDGVMGSATRAAIEKFERDRKLPVRGEAAGRTLRELAARSGVTG